MELREAWPPSKDYLEKYDDLLKELHDDAVKIAANIEKLMITKGRENEE